VNCEDGYKFASVVNRIIPASAPLYGRGNIKINLTRRLACDKRGTNLVGIDLITEYGDNEIKYKINTKNIKPKDLNPLAPKNEAIPSFIRKDSIGDFFIPAGNWVVNQPIIFPYGKDLKIAAGANISFMPGASLIINGRLNASGNALNPITLRGHNDKYWNGIYIYGSNKPSLLKNVKIKNLNVIPNRLLSLTGGITFYGTSVIIDGINIDNVTSEDAINFVHTQFSIKNANILNTRSDAIDSDFSSGYIENSSFSSIGGDAIDLSGSTINISSVTAFNVKDKAISVGEKSRSSIVDLSVAVAGTGIAVKDESYAEVHGFKAKNLANNVFMVYNKKTEYGPATLVAKTVDDYSNLSQVQFGNSLVLNEISIKQQSINVNNLYSSGSMKK
ncbi:hypothetical protein, partial [Polynucleobacter sp. 39-46-10]|uniref:hypothetical protein n=1 Tax=Polynucleobacter sp. 39-46-10 TaxID=1970428 RepID=UPI0025E16344